jgi:hypothetical protein
LFQPENPKPRKKQRSVKQQTEDLPPSVSKLLDLFQPENPKPRKKQRSVKQQTGDLPPSVSKLVKNRAHTHIHKQQKKGTRQNKSLKRHTSCYYSFFCENGFLFSLILQTVLHQIPPRRSFRVVCVIEWREW